MEIKKRIKFYILNIVVIVLIFATNIAILNAIENTGEIIDSSCSPLLENLFPQPINNNEFDVNGNGIFESTEYCIYKYDYLQNKTWTYHGFDLQVDTNSEYIFSFDAFISYDANINNSGTTWIADGEKGFSGGFYYDNTRKGTWQHFELTKVPTATTARLLLYPTTSNSIVTKGYVLYKNIEFKRIKDDINLFPQAKENNDFKVKGNGIFEVIPYSMYKYDYSQNKTWTYHGFDIPVDMNGYYTFSFDAYISPDADVPDVGNTFIANGEKGFSGAYYYDNTKKGTWQHFEVTKRPTLSVVRLLMYPSTLNIPAINGYIKYRNIEFKKTANINNLFPQPLDNKGFKVKSRGEFDREYKCKYTYDYSQNKTWTYHGFDIPVDMNGYYTFSFDAYISPDADIIDTGTTWIADGENGFRAGFYYDNTKKGTWQHFECTKKTTTNTARLLLYPTTSNIPATKGYIQYRNVEYRKIGVYDNLFSQTNYNDGFEVKGNGNFVCEEEPYRIFRYDYSQNKTWTYHGFDIKVNTNSEYTFSFDAFISQDADINTSGTTWIADGEQGFSGGFYYDNTKKGTWQHFELTKVPTSSKARLLLYPTTSNIPATSGYILYKNVEFRMKERVNNLFPQSKTNEEFYVKGNGEFESKPYSIYKYDYSENKTWTYHGFDIEVNKNLEYTFSFDAYISPDTDIPNDGVTWIADGEKGFAAGFYYDNTKKGTWQHFECTKKTTTNTARLLLYPTTSNLPATKGHILFRNVEFKIKNFEWYEYPIDFEKEVSCIAGKTINLVLPAMDMIDLKQYIFTVRYKPDELEVIDLHTETFENELTVADFKDTQFYIYNLEPGLFKFKINRDIPFGELWSGVVNTIKFKALKNIDTKLNYTIEAEQ